MFVDVWVTHAPLFGALLTWKSWCQATLSSNILAVHFARELRAIFARELRAILSGQSSPVNSGNSGHRIGCSLRAIARKDDRRQEEDDRRQEEEDRRQEEEVSQRIEDCRRLEEEELEELEYIRSSCHHVISYESDNET